MTAPIDNRVYVVVRCYGSGEYYFPERKEIDMHMQDTVEDILGGQFRGVDRVFVFNAASGLASDISNMIAQKVYALALKNDTAIPDDVRAFLHTHLGAEAVP